MNTVVNEFGWVEEVPLSSFSNKALIIASRFARVLKRVNGNQIVLQDKHLAKKIRHEVDETNDPKLRSLFDELVVELKTFAETRNQPRYRGSVQKPAVEKEATTTKSDSPKTVMYRGVEIEVDIQTPQASKVANKSYYRGFEVEG